MNPLEACRRVKDAFDEVRDGRVLSPAEWQALYEAVEQALRAPRPAESVEDARRRILTFSENGSLCPVCEREVTLYDRTMTSEIARPLIALYHLDRLNPGEEWFHYLRFAQLPTYKGVSRYWGDYGKGKYWGLLEAGCPRTRLENASGYWHITEAGRDFVKGIRLVPRRLYVYNDQVRDQDTDYISIRQALGKHFDYAALMSADVPIQEP